MTILIMIAAFISMWLGLFQWGFVIIQSVFNLDDSDTLFTISALSGCFALLFWDA